MLVLAGSRGQSTSTPSAPRSLSTQRQSLLKESVITLDDSGLLFIQDYLFRTPSAASAFLSGRTSNGRDAWKTAAGVSINDLEQLALDAAGEDSSTDA
jgi:hypothetical protein